MLVVGVATIAIRATGPVLLARRELPRRLLDIVELLAPEERDKVPRGQHPRIGEALICFNPQPVAPALHARSPGA